MGSLLLVIVVSLLCAGWVWSNRLHRRRWLQRLDLPGAWIWEDHDGDLILEGGLDGGRYWLREGDREQQGDWRLVGHDLALEPRSGQPSALDLRLFDDGKIGLHGPGYEHRIYVKKRSNVIPLRRPA